VLTITKPRSNNKEISSLVKAALFTANIVGLLVAALGALVLLIGVYHTAAFVLAKITAPLFLTFLPALTVAFVAGVIFLKQPVHQLLCLIAVFFNTVLLYLYVGSEFLAFLFLIIYVGAVAILFLFVVMLLHLKAKSVVPAVFVAGAAVYLLPMIVTTVVGVDDLVSFAVSAFVAASDLLSLTTEPNSVTALT
jgi:NADH:ubiquinone oxidoreductase subunit 6 (subunit J)